MELGAWTCLTLLQGNQGVTDEGIAHVGHMPELKSLELQFCWQLTDAGMSFAYVTCSTQCLVSSLLSNSIQQFRAAC